MSDDPVSTIRIETTDGEVLEAELCCPPGARLGVVITHPHPAYGGSMRTPVPATLFQTSRRIGVGALRFNFRGVGLSSGTHDGGRAERLDVAAALARLETEVAGPLLLAGWSFGADVAMAVDHPRLAGWLGVAAPLGVVDIAEMVASRAPEPTRLLVPQHDQFRSPAAARQATRDWINTEVIELPGTDHFLAGALHRVDGALVELVEDLT